MSLFSFFHIFIIYYLDADQMTWYGYGLFYVGLCFVLFSIILQKYYGLAFVFIEQVLGKHAHDMGAESILIVSY